MDDSPRNFIGLTFGTCSGRPLPGRGMLKGKRRNQPSQTLRLSEKEAAGLGCFVSFALLNCSHVSLPTFTDRTLLRVLFCPCGLFVCSSFVFVLFHFAVGTCWILFGHLCERTLLRHARPFSSFPSGGHLLNSVVCLCLSFMCE